MPESYNDATIKALSRRQHLMKRMALIFGDPETDDVKYSAQKNVAVRELLDNALDEVRSGYGDHVSLSFFKDGSLEVYDSGRGIPTGPNKDSEGRPISTLALALSHMQAGGKFSTDSKRYSSGLNGLGGSAVINVSRRVSVWVYRDKKEHFLEFKDGVAGFFEGDGPEAPFTPLEDQTYVASTPDPRPAHEKKNFKTGTKIKTWLDDSAFTSDNPYDSGDIIERLRGTAFLVPTLVATFYNEQNPIADPETGEMKPQEEVFHFPGGMETLVDLNQIDAPLMETMKLSTEAKFTERNVAVLQDDGNVVNQNVSRTTPIELALRWGEKYNYSMSSYVNAIHTKLGGVHEVAFERAMRDAFNERFLSMRGLKINKEAPPIIEDYQEGLTAVLSVEVSEPVFNSQSKEALRGREVLNAIYDALLKEFRKWIADKSNADTVAMIAKKVTTAAESRAKAAAQRDLARKNNEVSSAKLPTKLIDCDEAGSEAAELYICEGDSAKTALKAARDSRVNALLPIRGKILNVYNETDGGKALDKKTIEKIFKSGPISDIMTALGGGAGPAFNSEKARYGRVLFAVDADVDGNNIAAQLYGLFWVLFRPMVEEGRVYKIETPLFAISTMENRKQKKYYARDEGERDRIVGELQEAGQKFEFSRLKGLGEMKEDDLEETAISPSTRIITRVLPGEAEAAAHWIDVILGTDANLRKIWLEENGIELVDE